MVLSIDYILLAMLIDINSVDLIAEKIDTKIKGHLSPNKSHNNNNASV